MDYAIELCSSIAFTCFWCAGVLIEKVLASVSDCTPCYPGIKHRGQRVQSALCPRVNHGRIGCSSMQKNQMIKSPGVVIMRLTIVGSVTYPCSAFLLSHPDSCSRYTAMRLDGLPVGEYQSLLRRFRRSHNHLNPDW